MSTYLLDAPIPATEILEVEQVNLVVAQFTNYPMSEISAAFDGTFQVLFPALTAQGIKPIGPALALYHEVPSDTVTFEVGIPVDRPLPEDIPNDAGIILTNSSLPAGKIARRTYIGPFDGLGQAWTEFMDSVESASVAGHQPAFPCWEVYVTEPAPDADPATLRTDLYTAVSG